jgi:hypothetical protein
VHHLSKRSLLLNFIIGIIVLLNSASWASLMVITTAFNVLGYMGAPLSLAVLGSKKISTKLMTLFVFVVLALLLAILPVKDFLLNNLAITIMMAVYAVLQLKQGGFNWFALSFTLFLWVLMLVASSIIATIMLAIVFFLIVTSERFISKLGHRLS